MFGRWGRNICIGKALGRGGEFHGERILAIRLSPLPSSASVVGRMQMFMHDSGGRNVGRISSRYTRKRGWKQFPLLPRPPPPNCRIYTQQRQDDLLKRLYTRWIWSWELKKIIWRYPNAPMYFQQRYNTAVNIGAVKMHKITHSQPPADV